MQPTHLRFSTLHSRLQSAGQSSPVMKYGEKGYAVRLLQQALIDQGIPLPKSTEKHGTPDGDYGSETKAKVKVFQRKHHLDDDGRVGTDTMGKLDEVVTYQARPNLPPLPGDDDDVVDMAERARDLVLATLTSPYIQSVQVAIYTHIEVDDNGQIVKGTPISTASVQPHHIHAVRKAVHEDRILVGYKETNAYWGIYKPYLDPSDAEDFVPNELRLSFYKLDGDPNFLRSVIVHEAIHAAHDMIGIPRRVWDSEAAAFVGQAIFYRKASGGHKSIADCAELNADPLLRDVCAAADALAQCLHRPPDEGPDGYQERLKNYDRLRVELYDQIRSHKDYSDGGWYSYDGV